MYISLFKNCLLLFQRCIIVVYSAALFSSNKGFSVLYEQCYLGEEKSTHGSLLKPDAVLSKLAIN